MPQTMDRPTTLSPQEVADALGMSRRTIYRWINDRDLDTTQPSGKAKSRHRIFERQLAEKIGEEDAAEVFNAYANDEA
ncbi:helix-turn-helix domain-containing protein [Salinibacter altiplanensis]|uniref:helix-turn-helix domain-containing protein n=1 Tax=Salinibacter altiplanensis TaxID=1803181 RepID=UPI000C9EE482|nr:helix-turn-helix domain-containing protein [Salinibacter altiplanensis]